jgi:uncharacterized membrane protein YkvA (DUF1232 family)
MGPDDPTSENEFSKAYSDAGFWDKAKRAARVAGEAVLTPALTLYYTALDPKTPVWAKTVCFSALGYFVTPIDAIPDLTPAVGYSDDVGVLVAASATVAAHVTAAHVRQAKDALRDWFGDDAPSGGPANSAA